ncbi:MAG: hypothetical protein LUE09_13360 [Synergistaceae bacterium]|nr:hypothetical protein [Synergistaceae bacterium]
MSGFITWRGVKLFIILAIVLYFPAKLEAGEVYKSHYAAFCAAHENLSSSLSSDVKKYYLESHAAFYLAAERENLAIFHGVLVTRKKEKLYIYRNTLNAILKRRIAELESLHEKNGVWFSLKTRDNLARAFAAVNQRVPYDRGEKLRPTFREMPTGPGRNMSEPRGSFTLYISKMIKQLRRAAIEYFVS